MKEIIVLFLLFSIVFSISTIGEFEVKYNFDLTQGDRGTVSLLELPLNFQGQIGLCDKTSFDFPPFSEEVICNVKTSADIDQNFTTYSSSDLISATQNMKNLAGERIRGLTNDFEKAMNLASWIRANVKYDLGVGETQESAEWTFVNKVGTCDELSHLFISLAKSVELNARYISGYAFDGEKWLPHAWAEVWTRYGWLPIDVAFDQFAYIDAGHIIVDKALDGNHNFLTLSYFGEAPQINHEYEITTLKLNEVPIILNSSIQDAKGGAFTLMSIKLNNPFSNPIVLFPSISFPDGFYGEVIYPTTFVKLYPGIHTVYFVLSLPRLQPNLVYNIPVTFSIANEVIYTNFSASENKQCEKLKEVKPFNFDVSGCFDLNKKKNVDGLVTSGNFYCDGCFYSIEEPSSRVYGYNYPNFCEFNCSLEIEIIGSGVYDIEVNGNKTSGTVNVYDLLNFPLKIGENKISVDGVNKLIVVRAPPEIYVQKTQEKKQVCFESNWDMAKDCFSLGCGKNEIALNFSYGNLNRIKEYSIERKCNLFERILAFLGL